MFTACMKEIWNSKTFWMYLVCQFIECNISIYFLWANLQTWRNNIVLGPINLTSSSRKALKRRGYNFHAKNTQNVPLSLKDANIEESMYDGGFSILKILLREYLIILRKHRDYDASSWKNNYLWYCKIYFRDIYNLMISSLFYKFYNWYIMFKINQWVLEVRNVQ